MKFRLIESDDAEKYRLYNEKQTEVGSPLKTYTGSIIKRYQNNVGKAIGGKIYAHKDYIDEIVPKDVLKNAFDVLKNSDYKNFKWNCFFWDTKNNDICFQEGPDFDTSREPVVGKVVKVHDDKIITGTYNQIWHHKWLWVKNNYDGFDVEASWNWSKKWLSTLQEASNGSNIENWKKQLSKYNLK